MRCFVLVVGALGVGALCHCGARPFAKPAPELWVHASAGLHLREKPNRESASIRIMPDGASVRLLDYAREELWIAGRSGRWARVRFDEHEGYAFSGYLAETAERSLSPATVWFLGDRDLWMQADGSYSTTPGLFGGGACRGHYYRLGMDVILADHRCNHPGNFDEYKLEQPNPWARCRLRPTPDDFFSTVVLDCDRLGAVPGLDYRVPQGARRKRHGREWEILDSRCQASEEAILRSAPQINASVIEMEHHDLQESYSTSRIPANQSILCVVQSVARLPGELGRWYYVGTPVQLASAAILEYGWIFLEKEPRLLGDWLEN